MSYTNSKLVAYTKLSPNHSGLRTHTIDRISPHCVVGQCAIETLGNVFADRNKEASSNYGIGYDGKIGMFVEEKNRSWCTSSNSNDQRAVTIECASDTTEPYTMNSAVYESLVRLCTDICKRNGKKKLLWFADKDKTLNYVPKSNEMVLTVHRWFANKSCPGDWLYNRLGDLAKKVTANLGGSSSEPVTNNTIYRVRKSWSDSKSQKGAFKDLSNAKKCADSNKGYYVFDNNGKKVYPTDSVAKEIKVGSKVKLKSGATTYLSTIKLQDWCYDTVFDVIELSGDRAVIGIDGKVTSAVNVKDLNKWTHI